MKLAAALPQGGTKPRGILTSKKMKIVRDLILKMPSSRRDFWHSLPKSDTSPDRASSLCVKNDHF